MLAARIGQRLILALTLAVALSGLGCDGPKNVPIFGEEHRPPNRAAATEPAWWIPLRLMARPETLEAVDALAPTWRERGATGAIVELYRDGLTPFPISAPIANSFRRTDPAWDETDALRAVVLSTQRAGLRIGGQFPLWRRGGAPTVSDDARWIDATTSGALLQHIAVARHAVTHYALDAVLAVDTMPPGTAIGLTANDAAARETTLTDGLQLLRDEIRAARPETKLVLVVGADALSPSTTTAIPTTPLPVLWAETRLIDAIVVTVIADADPESPADTGRSTGLTPERAEDILGFIPRVLPVDFPWLLGVDEAAPAWRDAAKRLGARGVVGGI